ncbi:MAG: hypothetical protein JXA73_20645 [Acidobacteria bacterium]|nr:hypothetical protein [Acidobacteriota bacterium]
MKCKILWIGIIVLIALPGAVSAADIFGNWIAKLSLFPRTEDMMTAITETIFSFEPAGSRLNGTVTDSQGTFPISNGKINGDKISFVVIGKPSGIDVKLKFEGKVSLNEIQFTLEIEDMKTPPRKFTARREFMRHNDYIPGRQEMPVSPEPYR